MFIKSAATVATLVVAVSIVGVKASIDNALQGQAMDRRLFVHYLEASGEAVSTDFFTAEEVNKVKVLCEGDIRVSLVTALTKAGLQVENDRSVVSSYGTETQNALGNFTCMPTGAYDLYDFEYAPSGLGKKKYKSVGFYYDSVLCFSELHAALMAKCLVKKGYGKPFKVHLKY
jgi:hypothetical protein